MSPPPLARLLALLLIPGAGARAAPGELAPVVSLAVEAHETAVGTLRPVAEAVVSAQVSGVVQEVRAQEGSEVATGTLLAVIDDRELAHRRAQATGALAQAQATASAATHERSAARALLARARLEHGRVSKLFAGKVATPQQQEQADAELAAAEASARAADEAVTAAQAGAERARAALDELEVQLGHARVRSPLAGVLADRMVDPGDLAWPGRALFLVQEPSRLRLEADVREGLTPRLARGDRLEVRVDATGRDYPGTVAEIVPTSDPGSRKFRIKVALPPQPPGSGLLPGMFGRVRIPLGTRPAVLVPAAAVRRVGQLELVEVAGAGGVETRFVRLGEAYGESLEVLAGLAPGERVRLDR